MRNSNMHVQYMLYKINHNSLPIHSIIDTPINGELQYEAYMIMTLQKWLLVPFFHESGKNRHCSLVNYIR